MKKVFFIILILALIIIYFPLNTQATSKADTSGPPEIISESAVLMDAETGQVLFEKNMNIKQYPASITKIMTVFLGVESGNLQAQFTMSHDAVFSVPRDASHIALTPGETITMEQACYAAMLQSANEACNGIAEYVGGTMDNFAKLMTAKAKEFGALGTNFTNANGLHNENHYTTAYDMAMITKGAIGNPVFRQFFGTIQYTMSPTNKQPEARNLTGHHSMLKNTKFEYEGAQGGKTGWTGDSKHTLVTLAKRGDRELIAVVMRSENPDDKYIDTTALFDYGFNEFNEIVFSQDEIKDENIPMSAGKNAGAVEVMASDDVTFLLHKDIDKSMIDITYDLLDEPVAKAVFELKEDTGLMYGKLGTAKLQTLAQTAGLTQNTQSFNFIKPVLIVLVILLVLFILYLYICYMDVKKRKQRRKRRNNSSYKAKRYSGSSHKQNARGKVKK